MIRRSHEFRYFASNKCTKILFVYLYSSLSRMEPKQFQTRKQFLSTRTQRKTSCHTSEHRGERRRGDGVEPAELVPAMRGAAQWTVVVVLVDVRIARLARRGALRGWSGVGGSAPGRALTAPRRPARGGPTPPTPRRAQPQGRRPRQRPGPRPGRGTGRNAFCHILAICARRVRRETFPLLQGNASREYRSARALGRL